MGASETEERVVVELGPEEASMLRLVLDEIEGEDCAAVCFCQLRRQLDSALKKGTPDATD